MKSLDLKSFHWLNATQFLGALNDNIFKLLIILFLIKANGQASAANIAATTGAVFVLPFLIFTAYAGKLADKLSKRNIVIATKIAEVAIMAIGLAAFIANSQPALYATLFLMAAQSAFFSPAKYGIIPELVKAKDLSRVNGLLEAATYLAIVLGMASAPMLSQITHESFLIMGIICITIATLGLIVSFNIPTTPALNHKRPSSLFFIKDIYKTIQGISKNKDLLMSVIASAYFLLAGGFIYSNLIPYGIKYLSLTETQSGYLFVVAALGIGAGSFIAGKLSDRNVEFGVVPIGAIGLTLSSIGLALTPNAAMVYALVLIMGLSSGLFIVPIHAFIQLKSPANKRGEILAASSFLGWIGVLAASGLIYILSNTFSLSAASLFMVLGIMTLIPTLITIIVLPDFLVRFLCIMLTKFCYKIKVHGIDNVPTDKSALLVSNHIAWSDALLIAATQQRRVRFIMARDFYNKRWLKPICKLMRVIPISPTDPPKQILKSLKEARQAMDDGYMVCIFAEGMLTRTGMINEFKPGFERIIKNTDYEIIPIYLGGVWGSIFSHEGGKILKKIPKKFPYPVSVYFGQSLPSDTSVVKVQQKVTELSCEYFESLNNNKRLLGRNFIKMARKNYKKQCLADDKGNCLTYRQALTKSIILGNRINKLHDNNKIGILLPPSTQGALVNIACTIYGKTTINLNYTLNNHSLQEMIKAANLKHVITSKQFIEKAGLDLNCKEFLMLEDLAKDVTVSEKISAAIKAFIKPARKFTCNNTGDDTATIIFSSGSSGTPKGIMLSHHNIISNIESLRMVIQTNSDDKLCGVLPFFHSFGFNCSLWMPLLCGIAVTYITNPLDGKTVAKAVSNNKATMLFAPPAFLINYIRRADVHDFKTLRLVIAGAEKLKQSVADKFEQKFNIRPLEGYGTTELSPVASLNIPDIKADGIYHVGTKPGSVGHLIPGVAAKIIDIKTNDTLDQNQQGLILIKGPNVMKGYLNNQELTEQVLQDGWYNTGDIGSIDKDGFLTITARLSRFSKIGGEMVPHIKVEETITDILGLDKLEIAVTSIDDNTKGEQLIVLYTKDTISKKKLSDAISKSNMPNLYKPNPKNILPVDSIPLLGSGKLDVIKLKEIAQQKISITTKGI